MISRRVFAASLLLAGGLVPAALVAQQGTGLDPSVLLKMPTDSWPTYHGDYSGRRYSALNQINADNVKNLQLAWVYRLNTSQALANMAAKGPTCLRPPQTDSARRRSRRRR